MTKKTDWTPISDGLPDFTKYSFHTGRKVYIRRADGSEKLDIYQGYGLFGNGLSMFAQVTHWRPED